MGDTGWSAQSLGGQPIQDAKRFQEIVKYTQRNFWGHQIVFEMCLAAVKELPRLKMPGQSQKSVWQFYKDRCAADVKWSAQGKEFAVEHVAKMNYWVLRKVFGKGEDLLAAGVDLMVCFLPSVAARTFGKLAVPLKHLQDTKTDDLEKLWAPMNPRIINDVIDKMASKFEKNDEKIEAEQKILATQSLNQCYHHVLSQEIP